MSVAAPLPENNGLSGAGLRWPLHPACAAWPAMSPSDLRNLADDIAANGLRDPVTLTPDGLLLDGRNRSAACFMAGASSRAPKSTPAIPCRSFSAAISTAGT